jgi:microcin C transport system permease protein
MRLPFFKVTEITRRRWEVFRNHKRAYWSLLILLAVYVFSLFSPWLVNDKPLYLKYGQKTYFPAFKFYPETEFGGPYGTEQDYLALLAQPDFQEKGGWALMPPVPHNPNRPYLDLAGNPPHPPSPQHWLGTDATARDVLARLIHGFRIAMTFSLLVTFLSTLVGVILGGIQGYFGKATDLVGQRLTEIWDSLPTLYVIILLGAIYGRTMWMLIFVVTVFGWIGTSIYVRAEFLRLKNLPYVTASRSLGASHWRLIFQQIMPNALGPIITLTPFSVIAGIGALTSLDFLGFGLPPPTPSWGEMLQQGLDRLFAPWLATSAVLALFITLQLVSFVGEGFRTAFDPRSSIKLR